MKSHAALADSSSFFHCYHGYRQYSPGLLLTLKEMSESDDYDAGSEILISERISGHYGDRCY